MKKGKLLEMYPAKEREGYKKKTGTLCQGSYKQWHFLVTVRNQHHHFFNLFDNGKLYVVCYWKHPVAVAKVERWTA